MRQRVPHHVSWVGINVLPIVRIVASDTQSTSKQKPLSLLIAFALGATLAAIVFAAWPKANGTTQPTATPAQEQGVAGQVATAQGEPVDIAATFPSWDPDSASLAKLVAFVQDVTDPASPNYREPVERIATFDMDGTLICERHPSTSTT